MTQNQEVINISALEVTPELKALQADNWRKLKTKFLIGCVAVCGFVFLVPILPAPFRIMAVLLVAVLSSSLPYVFSRGKATPNLFLQQFAADNGLSYENYPKYISKGVIFYVKAHNQEVFNMLSGAMYDYDYSLYWYSFTTGSGKSAEDYSYGVIEVRLPKVVPNIFLDYQSNNGMLGKEVLNLFQRNNLLDLEGNFNDHFRVYAVEGYETEVLQLLNPAFMQALIHNADYDVELVDDRAFIYLPREYVPDKETIMRMYSAAEFLILELQKELDTFSFKPHTKIADEMAVQD